MKSVTPQELFSRHEHGDELELIDVRTPLEYSEMHIGFARNVPLDELDPDALFENRNEKSDQPLYVICNSGARSTKACAKIIKRVDGNVINVEGGTKAWDDAGLPVVRGKKAMSLERQVRIAAGSLVLIGVGLGFGVHPALFGLSAFVGAGLVFAGVTDTCGMGMLLARMPWNKRGGCCATGE